MILTNPLSIAFIGGGNMAKALMGGLLARSDQHQIVVSEPNTALHGELQAQFPAVRVTASNRDAAGMAQVWVLAIKPQYVALVCRELADIAGVHSPLVISVAAGIRTAELCRWLGPQAAVVRAMPNRPALVNAGMTGLYAPDSVSPESRQTAQAILDSVGRVAWVNSDEDIDSVTAISGSGPAYFFLLTELLEEAALQQGLSPEVARLLARQTAWGSASLLHGTHETAARLRAEVTSQGGTTEAALAVMANRDLRDIVIKAVHAAKSRAEELANKLSAE